MSTPGQSLPHRLRFCDRLAELRTLRRLISQPTSNPTGCLVLGAPGVGKSTLAEVVLEDARTRGFLPLAVAAERHGHDIAYSAVRSLVESAPRQERDAFQNRNLLEFNQWIGERVSSAGGGLSRELVATGIGYVAQPVASVIRQTGASVGPQVLLQSLLFNQESSFVEYLTYLTDSGPTLLIIDDFHWLDAASAATLQRFLSASKEEQLVVLVQYRPYECAANQAASELVSTLTDGGWPSLQIGGLPHKALAASLRETAPDVPPQVLTAIVAASDGNPLLASEDLALRIQERVTGDGHSIESRTAGLGHATRLQQIVRRRSTYLSSQARELLHVAACAGQSFSIADAVAVLGVFAARLSIGGSAQVSAVASLFDMPRILEEIQDSGFAQAVSQLEGVRFRFTHPLIHDSIYQCISPAKRIVIHSCIAELLFSRFRNQESIDFAEVGRHHREAREYRQAANAYLRGSRLSWNVENYRHAAHQLTASLECLDAVLESGVAWKSAARTRTRVALQLRLAESLHRSGEFEHARSECLRIIERETLPNEVQRARAHFWFGKAEYFIGDDRLAVNHYDQAASIFRHVNDRARLARTLNAKASSLVQVGDAQEGSHSYAAALTLVREVEERAPRIAIEVYQQSGMVLSPKEAIPLLTRGISLARVRGWNRLLGLLLHNRGVEEYYVGSLEDAEADFQEARALLVQTISFELVYTLNSLAVLRLVQHHYDEADHYLSQAERRLVANFDRIWIANNRAALEDASGNTREGIALLSSLLPLIEQHSDPVIRENSFFNLGVLYQHASAYSEARTYLRRSINRGTLYEKHAAYAKRYRVLARVLRATDRVRAADRLDRLSKRLFELDSPENWSFRDLEFILCHLSNYH